MGSGHETAAGDRRPIRTRVQTTDGRELAFQEYFVRERHDVDVASVEIDGIDSAQPAPGVLDAISQADAIVDRSVQSCGVHRSGARCARRA